VYPNADDMPGTASCCKQSGLEHKNKINVIGFRPLPGLVQADSGIDVTFIYCDHHEMNVTVVS
jgi:hypothetical protein